MFNYLFNGYFFLCFCVSALDSETELTIGSEKESGIPITAIIAIVVGSFALILIIAAVIVIFKFKK